MKGITDTEIIVANSAPMSGPYIASGDPMNAGIRSYFDMVNAAGGIDGRKIRFLHQDDGNDPVRGQKLLEHFLSEEVFAYIGHFGSEVVSATLDRVKESGMPVVYFFTAIHDLYGEQVQTPAEGRRCFPIQTIYVTEGRGLVARCVSDLHASSIGVIYSEDDTGRDIMDGIHRQCGKLSLPCTARGVSIAPEALEQALPEVVAEVLSHNPDAIVLACSRAAFAPAALELARQKNTRPAITSYVNMIITEAFKIFDDVLGQYRLYAPSWVDYQNEHLHNLEEASEWLGDYALHAYAHCGWMAAYVFCEALKRLHGETPTWENFTRAMEEAPFDLPFAGRIDFADGVRLGAQEMTLSELDRSAPTGWAQIDGLRSIDELLKKAR